MNVSSVSNASAYNLLQVSRGQTFTVVGRRSDNRWLQISANGVIGWVNASYVVAYNVNSVPITA